MKWVVFLFFAGVFGVQWASWAYDRAHARPRPVATRVAIGLLYFVCFIIVVRGWFIIIRDGFWTPFERWFQ
jgi:cytochrome b561